jgi:hypothetical protein
VTPSVVAPDRSALRAGSNGDAVRPAAGRARPTWWDRIRLAHWKALQTSTRLRDELGGRRLLRLRSAEWERRWLTWSDGRTEPLTEWLTRAGAGKFWLPTPAEQWLSESCSPADLQVAREAAAGNFDLLGSGRVELGATPQWRRDLYSGFDWPLERSASYRLVRGGGSDIRTVWELSRGYHLLPLARAFAVTGDSVWPDTFTRHVDSWMEQNPLGAGPHWASPMDAAIRASNWCLAMIGFAGAEDISRGFWGRMLRNLLETGFFLERNLEWHPIYRGNHYVSNGVGLIYLGTLFRDTADGARWLRKGSRILREEIEWQVGADGVSFESSLAYHRLVTEFFAFGGELIRLNDLDGLPAGYEDRLRRMYSFIATYLPPSGEAPVIGDADDGRLHTVSTEGWLHPRRHALGLPERYWPDEPPAASAHPSGGFYVMRAGRHHIVIRCGPVGIRGAGSHDHNDQLSLELVLGGTRVLSDSGTYAYTRDLVARSMFRSTASHSVLQLGDEEQNPIRENRPWRILEDRTRSRCLEWKIEDDSQLFTGEHAGYAHRASGAICRRTVRLRPSLNQLWLEDIVTGRGMEDIKWRVHFAAGDLEDLGSMDGTHRFSFMSDTRVSVEVRAPSELRVKITDGPASDRYGVKYSRPVLLVEGRVELPFTIETSLALTDQ